MPDIQETNLAPPWESSMCSPSFLAQLHNRTFTGNVSAWSLLGNCTVWDYGIFANEGSPALRIIISLVYSIVCAVGLVGNLFVFYVMHSKQARKKSTINFYVLNLAVTDFQFVLVLPFWAVETGLDFNWPFGDAICRIVSSLTLLNMYASVSFLTAMSVARYWAIASGLQARSRPAIFTPSWASVFIWLTACAASIPTAVFSTVVHVSGVSLCITKFPEGEEFWLSVYNIQKIVLGFLLPLLIISICYQLLLRFLREKNPVGAKKPGRRSKVTRSITVVVLSFFVCWFPKHAITFWGVLVKLRVVPFSDMYYTTQEYVYPVTLCLAHSNSCLNPLLYCLLRKDIRQSLRQLLWHQATSPKSAINVCHLQPCPRTCRPDQVSEDVQPVVHLTREIKVSASAPQSLQLHRCLSTFVHGRSDPIRRSVQVAPSAEPTALPALDIHQEHLPACSTVSSIHHSSIVRTESLPVMVPMTKSH